MALFQEALADGTMMGFFKLVEQYRTQTEPAFCGLTSLAMVLNALCIDPRRTWKAPWRWFDETLLDCCKALESVKAEGIDFEQVLSFSHKLPDSDFAAHMPGSVQWSSSQYASLWDISIGNVSGVDQDLLSKYRAASDRQLHKKKFQADRRWTL